MKSPPRHVVVSPEGKTASAYLGAVGWPFYRLGENVVPFEPPDGLLAIVFDSETPAPPYVDERVKRLRGELGLVPLQLEPDKPQSFLAANGAFWLFRTPDRRQAATWKPKIVPVLERDARIGVPVHLTPGRVSVLDNRFVVRFRDELSARRIAELVEEAGAVVLRRLIQATNARLIEFRKGGYLNHLAVVEEWFAAGHLVYGEPDLLSEFLDHAFPSTAPNDPKYKDQDYLPLQGVDGAWRYLRGIRKKLTLGSPKVYVATLDTGVETTHFDIGKKLTDGKKQLARCYDFERRKACSAAGYEPDYHGTGVYGIVAARTNNKKGVAGIAPNTRQIALRRPNFLSAEYADALLWVAGFVTNHPKPWPAEPIARPADIINCSHGSNGTPLSGLMDDTFKLLTDQGRNGLGTVIVYAAGNSSTLITGFLTWAAHPRTIAVANSDPPAYGVESINVDSNFGPEIDLCAQGEGAWTITVEEEAEEGDGLRRFGGTSAAAPMVSAAAALMLSANSALRWSDVRDLLRVSAKKLDDGIGRPGEWTGDFSQRYGHGRLNVDGAVRAAHTFTP